MKPAGAVRQALAQLLEDGITGTYQAFASAAGVPPRTAQSTLWELTRCGAASARERKRRTAPAVYSRPSAPLDASAHVRQVWR